jgi:prepilin-type N-terminal cleavage/methylation domain-containing protein
MRHLKKQQSSRMRARRGFTLAELLVALMVFAVGALALVATSANVITLMTGGKNRGVAAAVAQARFERMRSQPCSLHTSDSTTGNGIASSWQVVNLSRADDVTVTVRFYSNRRQQTRVYRTFLPCP